MTHILHINDNNLCLVGNGTSERSQGYAWLKDGSVVFDTGGGHAPVKVCRLAPQEINSRYWQQCEQSSIGKNSAGMRHAADLIWSHLTQLKEAHGFNELVLVVPSHFQSANLQLLLGIAKSCGIAINGLLNKAVLSLHDQLEADGIYRHIDVQLHQTVCSQVHVANGLVKLGEVEVVPAVGIQAMQDALLKTVQHSFIQNDRFDPLHYAETEQQVFDQLPEAAKQIQAQGKTLISVQQQNQVHNTTVEQKLWDQTLSESLQAVLKLATSNVAQVADSFVDLNDAFSGGIPDVLDSAGISILTELSDRSAILKAVEGEQARSLVYVTELPLARKAASLANDDSKDAPVSKPIPTGATHLLQAGIATAIEHSDISIGDNQLSLSASAHGNAQALLDSGQLFIMSDESRKEFKPNDRLGSHLADGVITVIQVV